MDCSNPGEKDVVLVDDGEDNAYIGMVDKKGALLWGKQPVAPIDMLYTKTLYEISPLSLVLGPTKSRTIDCNYIITKLPPEFNFDGDTLSVEEGLQSHLVEFFTQAAKAYVEK